MVYSPAPVPGPPWLSGPLYVCLGKPQWSTQYFIHLLRPPEHSIDYMKQRPGLCGGSSPGWFKSDDGRGVVIQCMCRPMCMLVNSVKEGTEGGGGGRLSSPWKVWDLYVFDWFEAAAAALGSKICTEIFVHTLEPWILQRSPHILHIRILGGPGVQCDI